MAAMSVIWGNFIGIVHSLPSILFFPTSILSSSSSSCIYIYRPLTKSRVRCARDLWLRRGVAWYGVVDSPANLGRCVEWHHQWRARWHPWVTVPLGKWYYTLQLSVISSELWFGFTAGSSGILLMDSLGRSSYCREF
jgi:hypothetical protein